jgi:hypothetical protein
MGGADFLDIGRIDKKLHNSLLKIKSRSSFAESFSGTPTYCIYLLLRRNWSRHCFEQK